MPPVATRLRAEAAATARRPGTQARQEQRWAPVATGHTAHGGDMAAQRWAGAATGALDMQFMPAVQSGSGIGAWSMRVRSRCWGVGVKAPAWCESQRKSGRCVQVRQRTCKVSAEMGVVSRTLRNSIYCHG